MERQHKIRQGEIYWIDKFPALDGHDAKRRPVLALGHVDPNDLESPVLVVGISHTASSLKIDPDMVKLSDTQQNPSARTGLNRASWAVPRWALAINVDRFDRPSGYVKGAALQNILRAVLARRSKEPPSESTP